MTLFVPCVVDVIVLFSHLENIANVSILVSVQHTQVPLLQGDAVDHDEVVQVVLVGCCSYWCPASLGKSMRGEHNETGGGYTQSFIKGDKTRLDRIYGEYWMP